MCLCIPEREECTLQDGRGSVEITLTLIRQHRKKNLAHFWEYSICATPVNACIDFQIKWLVIQEKYRQLVEDVGTQ